MNVQQNEILLEAIKKWGSIQQLDMMVEECSEIIKAICKLKRAKDENEIKTREYHLMDELADVEIMCHQLRLMLNDDACIDRIKNEKITRVKERLNQSKP